MSKIVATLIAGLFATSVFAQSPASTSTAATSTEAKAEAKAGKDAEKAEAAGKKDQAGQ